MCALVLGRSAVDFTGKQGFFFFFCSAINPPPCLPFHAKKNTRKASSGHFPSLLLRQAETNRQERVMAGSTCLAGAHKKKKQHQAMHVILRHSRCTRAKHARRHHITRFPLCFWRFAMHFSHMHQRACEHAQQTRTQQLTHALCFVCFHVNRRNRFTCSGTSGKAPSREGENPDNFDSGNGLGLAARALQGARKGRAASH